MCISRARKNQRLILFRNEYIEKILEKFGMSNAKLVSMSLASHITLCKDMCPRA